MRSVVISGSGIHIPSDKISNEEIVDSFNRYVEKFNQKYATEIEAGEVVALQESSAAFIRKASGIENRSVVDKVGILDPERMVPNIPRRDASELSLQAEFAVKAAKMALDAAGCKPENIQAVIAGASMLQRSYPAIAIEVQQELGVTGYAFDMNVACSSATFAIQVAASQVATGMADRIIVVIPELTTGHVDFTDRDSHFIFSDAAAAVVVEAVECCDAENAFEIVDSKLVTEYSNNIRNDFGFLNRCEFGEADAEISNLFRQQGRRVFKEVVPLAANTILQHLAENDLDPKQLARLWLHQANQNMDRLIAQKVYGSDPDAQQVPIILHEYANTAAAGSIIAFHHHHDDLKQGDYGIICSFGAGYSIGNLLIKKWR